MGNPAQPERPAAPAPHPPKPKPPAAPAPHPPKPKPQAQRQATPPSDDDDNTVQLVCAQTACRC